MCGGGAVAGLVANPHLTVAAAIHASRWAARRRPPCSQRNPVLNRSKSYRALSRWQAPGDSNARPIGRSNRCPPCHSPLPHLTARTPRSLQPHGPGAPPPGAPAMPAHANTPSVPRPAGSGAMSAKQSVAHAPSPADGRGDQGVRGNRPANLLRQHPRFDTRPEPVRPTHPRSRRTSHTTHARSHPRSHGIMAWSHEKRFRHSVTPLPAHRPIVFRLLRVAWP
jgi:hypothetical protein